MDNVQRVDYSEYRLKRADEEIILSEIAFEKGIYLNSLSSSYYAIFHAIRSILIFDDFDSKTHSGVILFFSKNYIHTGKFDKKYSKIIAGAMNKRLMADYNDFYVISNERVLAQLNDAKEFINKVKKYHYKSVTLKLKVCGMREDQNIKDLLTLQSDFMGFIFFERSPRNVADKLNAELLLSFPDSVKKVGVFVNADIDFIKDKKEKYKLDYIQLHGHETPEYCHQLSTINYQLIKAFSVNEDFDFSTLKAYESSCEFFLFDTKGKNPGGNGEKFNWEILEKAEINKPFFLSGGIELEDISKVQSLKSKVSNLIALDINSKFETTPAFKDLEKIKNLKSILYGNAN